MKLRTPSRLSSQEEFGSLLMRHEPFFSFCDRNPSNSYWSKGKDKKEKKNSKKMFKIEKGKNNL
jgi:hypothetical protein